MEMSGRHSCLCASTWRNGEFIVPSVLSLGSIWR
jgi:hypothetical protein